MRDRMGGWVGIQCHTSFCVAPGSNAIFFFIFIFGFAAGLASEAKSFTPPSMFTTRQRRNRAQAFKIWTFYKSEWNFVASFFEFFQFSCKLNKVYNYNKNFHTHNNVWQTFVTSLLNYYNFVLPDKSYKKRVRMNRLKQDKVTTEQQTHAQELHNQRRLILRSRYIYVILSKM